MKYLPSILGAVAVSTAGIYATATVAQAQPAANSAGQLPVFEFDPDWPRIPENFRTPFVSGVVIDAEDNAWLVTRPRIAAPDESKITGPALMMFDPDGDYVGGWGGPGDGYEWPALEHNAYIDHNGFLWITGDSCRGRTPGAPSDDQILKFTTDGEFVMQLGRSNGGTDNTDTENFRRPPNVQVSPDTNELFIADGYQNQRIIVLDAATGEYKRMWGAFGNTPSYDGEDACFLPEPDSYEGDGAPYFNTPHVLLLSHDDLLYVADRGNRRIQVFTPEGEYVRQLARYDAPFGGNLAFSHDPDQTYLYTGYGDEIAVIERESMEVIGMIQTPNFEIDPSHQITVDSEGNLYVTFGAGGRMPERTTVERFIYKGMTQPQ